MELEGQQWRIDSLENDRVRLRLLKEDDFDDLHSVASDPLIWVEHPISDRYKKEVFREYFDQALFSTAAFLIIDKATDKIIGCTRFHDYSATDATIAIGFTFLSREYWGKKFNRSSKKLLLDFAFQFVDKVYFFVGASNIRPQMTIMKLGARLEGPGEYKNGGKSILQFRYVIHKSEWEWRG